jgi:trehalose 6-phosphate synthase
MESPIVVASNRGPVSFERDADGRLFPRRGSGGLVTALAGVFDRDDAVWLSAAMSDGDREVAAGGRAIESGSPLRLRFIEIPPERYDGYYNGVANGLLWFAHHFLWDIARSPSFGDDTERAWESYVETNRAFAKALAEEPDPNTVFLVQDYHLSLVPAMLRELRPEAKIVHFSHTPFAGPTYLRILPAHVRAAILRGLAGADVVGFQARIWVENFLLSARDAPGMKVLRGGRLSVDGRAALVRSFPVAVDAPAIRDTAAAPETVAIREELRVWKADMSLLLRVDRMEPSKNILRGFHAFELFLRRNPSWRGKVRFLALSTPSREDLPPYRDYADECLAEVARINGEFATDDWVPITVRLQEDYAFAVGAYGVYDALLVNPLYDGMNLVAMEGPVVNPRRGVLILSRNAGAFSRLGRHAIAVNPFDLNESAAAIKTALEMSAEERLRRSRGLQRSVLANTPPGWLASQLRAMDLARPPGPSS